MAEPEDEPSPATSRGISEVSKGRTALPQLRTRHAVLVLLLLQTTGIVLLMRYSKTRHVPYEAGDAAYRATAAVLMAEVLKLPICVLMAGRAVGGASQLALLVREEILGNVRDTFKCAVPAVAFTLQGNLLFVALENLEAPVYQVTYQSKTVFTALFSRLILGRKLKPSQWLALLLLCAGGVLVSDLETRRNPPSPPSAAW